MQSAMQPIAVEPHGLEISDNPDHRIAERIWGLDARTDRTVSFEEYLYWAKIERADEDERNRTYKEERGPLTVGKIIKGRFSKGVHYETRKKEEAAREAVIAGTLDAKVIDEKTGDVTVASTGSGSGVTEEEWRTAARALRTAGWGTIFYLVTTDILGWSTTPFVYTALGYGAATGLYVIFGIFALISGWILWKVFMTLDSSRFPMVSYGDTFFRVYGPWSRHFINVSQSLQQFMTVCVLILGGGTVISQLNGEHICFIACMIIVMGIGMVLGQIRSLQRFGWLANASVWLNVATFIIVMVAAAHYGIDFQAVFSSTLLKKAEPVVTFAGFPPDQYQSQATGFAGHFNGVNQMIYSWGGCLLFVAFLAEMRHPWDFWKGMLCGYLFILIIYVMFGAYTYHFYGQYAIFNIVNVIQPNNLQVAANVLSLLTTFIAAALYFNIGMKTVYLEVLEELLHFPPLSTKRGKVLWFFLGPLYWIVALIVAAAVPNLNGISSLVSALLILNFTYTFPGLLYFGFQIHMGARLPGEGFDPYTRQVTRHDEGVKRWLRGWRVNWATSTGALIYGLCGLACSGMGTWAAIEGLIAVFGPGGTVATSFGCASPV